MRGRSCGAPCDHRTLAPGARAATLFRLPCESAKTRRPVSRREQYMATVDEARLLTSPKIFLVGMTAFLAIVAFVALILSGPIAIAFQANPGLNSLIIGVLGIGGVFAYRQVFRLFREIAWVNSLTSNAPGVVAPPLLLGPMA